MDMVGISVSAAAVGIIAGRVIDDVRRRRQRPLDSRCPVVWMDAVRCRARSRGRCEDRAVCTVLGLNMEGRKEVPGLDAAEGGEGAGFRLSAPADLRNRGAEDVLTACADGLTGFPEAVRTVFPRTEAQLCAVHQMRQPLRCAASRHQKALMADLKLVCRALNREAAEQAMDKLEETWGDRCPVAVRSWRSRRGDLPACFRCPEPVRRVLCAADAAESARRRFRRLTRTRGAFPNEDSLMKLLCLGIQNAAGKRTRPIHNWNLVLSQLSIFFDGRLDEVLGL